AMAIPVCPTCSLCGRQCASATGRLHARAACNVFARSSTIPQFSGPFSPLPALTTISASVRGISPLDLLTLVTFTRPASTVVSKGTTSALPSPAVILYAFGFSAITLTSVLIAILANAFPEKTLFLTVNPFAVSGNATAPETSPAFNLSDRSEEGRGGSG